MDDKVFLNVFGACPPRMRIFVYADDDKLVYTHENFSFRNDERFTFHGIDCASLRVSSSRIDDDERKSKRPNKTLLWLDDMRDPVENKEGKVPYGFDTIEWVKDYASFVEYIKYNDMPYMISFDHDLAKEHYTPEKYWHDYEGSLKYQLGKRSTHKNKTGADCASWLVNYCHDNNIELPVCVVHSANPVGCDWIKYELSKYGVK